MQRIKLLPAYETRCGEMYHGPCETVLRTPRLARTKDKIQLLFTSPPFALHRKKSYGNKNGEEYIDWLTSYGPSFRDLLTKDGSIVMELGNAWEPGSPVMSTLTIRALLAFQERTGLHLCQEFVCYNPARLPTPAQWVTVDRIRVKDAFTRVWWMSPVERPKANNRNVLTEYSESMLRLLRRGKYNHGRRPSDHTMDEVSFLTDNGGAIPPNVLLPNGKNAAVAEELGLFEVLPISNTSASDPYLAYCRAKNLEIHPARMPARLAEFFIRFLTDKGDMVLDPFAGSNTTGEVAELLGRRWIAIEAKKEYVLGSRARFRGQITKSRIRLSPSAESRSSVPRTETAARR